MKKHGLLLGVLGLCLGLVSVSPSWAVAVPDLFRVAVPVASQADADRNQALRAGMQQVLTRVVVTPGGGPGIDPALLDSASRAVSLYSYEQGVDESGERFLALSMSFEPAVLESLAAKHGLRFWGANRPETLLCLRIGDPAHTGEITFDGAYVVSDQEPRELVTVLRNRSQEYRIPVILPLLDLQDQRLMTEPSFWSGAPQLLDELSQRYGARSTAVATFHPDGEGWRGRWALLIEGRRLTWENHAATRDGLLDAWLGDIAETLLREYAVALSDTVDESTLIQVQGIGNLAQYRAALDYLRSVQGVVNVVTRKIVDDQVVFSLTLSGTLAEVTRGIAFGGYLQALREPTGVIDANSIDLLRYRLVSRP